VLRLDKERDSPSSDELEHGGRTAGRMWLLSHGSRADLVKGP
jgi:hypothetical protein